MNKAIGCLGLAVKARRCISGEVLMKGFAKGGIHLVIMADDIGENSKKKLIDKCAFYNIPYAFLDKDDMASVMSNRKTVGITDKGFATQLHTCLKG